MIPGGSFQMGDGTWIGRDGDIHGVDNEVPVHTVAIKPFKLGKYEVTFDQWDACVSDGGLQGLPAERFTQCPRRPPCDLRLLGRSPLVYRLVERTHWWGLPLADRSGVGVCGPCREYNGLPLGGCNRQ